jgi:hypothetical protein
MAPTGTGRHPARGAGREGWHAEDGGAGRGPPDAPARRPPLLDAALAAEDITGSLAFTIAGWTRKLPPEMRASTDRILLQAPGQEGRPRRCPHRGQAIP